MNRLIHLFILFVLVLTSCSKSDDGNQQPAPVPTPDTLAVEGAMIQVMVVFAPGQLSDLSYADEVMESVVLMQQQQKRANIDSVDVNFMALYSFSDTRQRLRIWVEQTANPYYGHDYERRLLVLTEPYMAQWLSDINTMLRPTDEVLLLKTSEAELREVEATYGLGQRLHALNIDFSSSIRICATYMKDRLSSLQEAYGEGSENDGDNDGEEDDYGDDYGDDWYETDDWDTPIPDHVKVYIYRQYGASVVHYSDSITELLRQELGPEAEITELYIDDQLNDDHYTESNKNSYLEKVYQTAQQIGQQCHEEGFGYIIFDLGVWNVSAVQFMETVPRGIEAFLIDATSKYDLPYSYQMKLDYSRALKEWLFDWCQQSAVTMPPIRILSTDYINDDIPEYDKEWRID